MLIKCFDHLFLLWCYFCSTQCKTFCFEKKMPTVVFISHWHPSQNLNSLVSFHFLCRQNRLFICSWQPLLSFLPLILFLTQFPKIKSVVKWRCFSFFPAFCLNVSRLLSIRSKTYSYKVIGRNSNLPLRDKNHSACWQHLHFLTFHNSLLTNKWNKQMGKNAASHGQVSCVWDNESSFYFNMESQGWST